MHYWCILSGRTNKWLLIKRMTAVDINGKKQQKLIILCVKLTLNDRLGAMVKMIGDDIAILLE